MFVSGGTRHVGERDHRNSTHCHNVCVCEAYPATSRPFAPRTLLYHSSTLVTLLCHWRLFANMYILVSNIIISFRHLCNIIMSLKTFTNIYIQLSFFCFCFCLSSDRRGAASLREHNPITYSFAKWNMFSLLINIFYNCFSGIILSQTTMFNALRGLTNWIIFCFCFVITSKP